jgi:hypothetical protein
VLLSGFVLKATLSYFLLAVVVEKRGKMEQPAAAATVDVTPLKMEQLLTDWKAREGSGSSGNMNGTSSNKDGGNGSLDAATAQLLASMTPEQLQALLLAAGNKQPSPSQSAAAAAASPIAHARSASVPAAAAPVLVAAPATVAAGAPQFVLPRWLVVAIFAMFAGLLVALLKTVLFPHAPLPTSSGEVAYRMANVLEADFCMYVTPDEIRSGHARNNMIDLRAIRRTMVVHIKANGYRGMCAQHLAGAEPMCMCVLRTSEPTINGTLVAAKDSEFVDMYNLDVLTWSELLRMPVRERSAFCPSPFWNERYALITAAYLGDDGEYYERRFSGNLSAVVQNLWDMHYGYSFCTVGENKVMLKKLRDKQLYGKDITPVWASKDASRTIQQLQLSEGSARRTPLQLAPDGLPIHAAVPPSSVWQAQLTPAKRPHVGDEH